VTDWKEKVVFAVDPGFAQVKYSVGGKVGAIPSAVAEPLPSMEGLGKGQRVHFMDIGKFVVGKDALEPGSRQIQSLDEEWLLRYLPLLVVGAADHAGVNLHEVDVLAICVPPRTWSAARSGISSSLSNIRDRLPCRTATRKFAKLRSCFNRCPLSYVVYNTHYEQPGTYKAA